MIYATEMIINEKYLIDIDDDDESEVVDMPNKKVVSDKKRVRASHHRRTQG